MYKQCNQVECCKLKPSVSTMAVVFICWEESYVFVITVHMFTRSIGSTKSFLNTIRLLEIPILLLSVERTCSLKYTGILKVLDENCISLSSSVNKWGSWDTVTGMTIAWRGGFVQSWNESYKDSEPAAASPDHQAQLWLQHIETGKTAKCIQSQQGCRWCKNGGYPPFDTCISRATNGATMNANICPLLAVLPEFVKFRIPHQVGALLCFVFLYFFN